MTDDSESYQRPTEKEFQRLKAHTAHKPLLKNDANTSKEIVIWAVYDRDGSLRSTRVGEWDDRPDVPGVVIAVKSLTDYVDEFERRWEAAVSNRQ